MIANMILCFHGRRIAVGTDNTLHIVDCETGKSLNSKTLGMANLALPAQQNNHFLLNHRPYDKVCEHRRRKRYSSSWCYSWKDVGI